MSTSKYCRILINKILKKKKYFKHESDLYVTFMTISDFFSILKTLAHKWILEKEFIINTRITEFLWDVKELSFLITGRHFSIMIVQKDIFFTTSNLLLIYVWKFSLKIKKKNIINPYFALLYKRKFILIVYLCCFFWW